VKQECRFHRRHKDPGYSWTPSDLSDCAAPHQIPRLQPTFGFPADMLVARERRLAAVTTHLNHERVMLARKAGSPASTTAPQRGRQAWRYGVTRSDHEELAPLALQSHAILRINELLNWRWRRRDESMWPTPCDQVFWHRRVSVRRPTGRRIVGKYGTPANGPAALLKWLRPPNEGPNLVITFCEVSRGHARDECRLATEGPRVPR